MDANRKKALREAYQNRAPEMGVVSLRCKATGQSFLEISRDTHATMNSIRAKLSMRSHPNRTLIQLLDEYGAENFELSVLRVLDYEDPAEDHTEELTTLRDLCLLEDPNAAKLWK